MVTYTTSKPVYNKRGLGLQEIALFLVAIVVLVLMIVFFLNEVKSERNFQKHLNKEHNHSS